MEPRLCSVLCRVPRTTNVCKLRCVFTAVNARQVDESRQRLRLGCCCISRESQTTRNVYWSRSSVCVCVCMGELLSACVSVCPQRHAHTTARPDPDVTQGNGRGCPLVVHYWADLQSVQGFRCYDSIAANAKCQRVFVLALCLVVNCYREHVKLWLWRNKRCVLHSRARGCRIAWIVEAKCPIYCTMYMAG